ncbi:class I SAM-dependent methyltransferase [Rhizobacter sp. J219]|uniref:class I SAM-dependent methyltransferase n=1 Tax=Rhizobacter sp. J219 TaxID=2898430 RepID=UPI002151489E|nr:class I SAM-dependent methyltransferase [Rhizobacter sp. J219]MCR5884698.1 class I SAM-dependent methyltransferase [Rhizobacter sp. J219]
MTGAWLHRTHETIDAYYSAKVAEFGVTPRGVDWTCAATQNLRFIQLLRICDVASGVSLNDLGCGYGALLAFSRERHPGAALDYLGVDLSPAMVQAARSQWLDDPAVQFFVGATCPRVADVSIASGLFNVCLSVERHVWEDFIRATLRELRRASAKGFGVNFMAPLPEGAPAAEQLYRTAPGPWIDFCTTELGGRVQLVERYGLREFTLLVHL